MPADEVSAADRVEAVRAVVRLARLVECCSGDLTLPQYRILAMVDGGDERATRLAERLAVAKPTVTAVVDGLVERGFLERSPVPGDRRASRIATTPAGRRALRAAEATMAETLERVLTRVERPDDVVLALGALGPALDGLAAERLGAAR